MKKSRNFASILAMGAALGGLSPSPEYSDADRHEAERRRNSPYPSLPLTKKQRKARAKAKMARKARKKQRVKHWQMENTIRVEHLHRLIFRIHGGTYTINGKEFDIETQEIELEGSNYPVTFKIRISDATFNEVKSPTRGRSNGSELP